MIKYVTLKLFYRMIFLSEFVVFFFVMLKFLPQKYNKVKVFHWDHFVKLMRSIYIPFIFFLLQFFLVFTFLNYENSFSASYEQLHRILAKIENYIFHSKINM